MEIFKTFTWRYLLFTLFICLLSIPCTVFSESKALSKQQTLLIKAIKRNNIKQVKEILEEGVSLTSQNNEFNPLKTAVFFDNKKIVAELIKSKVDVNKKDLLGRTVLQFALDTYRPKLSIIKLLVEEGGANINTIDFIGETPLNTAARFNSHEIVEYLLDKGAIIHKSSCINGAPNSVHMAAKNGNLKTIEILLRHVENFINEKDKKQNSPIMYAVKNGKYKMYKYLIEQGADLNVVDDDQNTLLMLAVSGNNKRIVKDLIERGVDINAKNKYQENVMHKAAVDGNKTITKILLEARADVNIKNSTFSRSPLDDSITWGNKGVFKVLLRDANQETIRRALLHSLKGNRDSYYYKRLLKMVTFDQSLIDQAFSVALQYENYKMVKYFLNKNASINKQVKTYHPPLHLSIRTNGNKIFDLIMKENNIDFSVKDNEGNNALMSAIKANSSYKIKELMKKGVTVETINNNDETPLFLAIANNVDQEIFDLVLEKSSPLAISGNGRFDQTPLYVAISQNNFYVIKRLLDKCANPFVKGNTFSTAYYLATIKGSEKILAMIKESRNECAKNNSLTTVVDKKNNKIDSSKVKFNSSTYQFPGKIKEYTISSDRTKMVALLEDGSLIYRDLSRGITVLYPNRVTNIRELKFSKEGGRVSFLKDFQNDEKLTLNVWNPGINSVSSTHFNGVVKQTVIPKDREENLFFNSGEEIIKLNLTTGKQSTITEASEDSSFTFSPGNNFIIIKDKKGFNNEIVNISSKGKKYLTKLYLGNSYRRRENKIFFNHDESILYSTEHDEYVVYNLKNTKKLMSGISTTVYSNIQFSKDNKLIYKLGRSYGKSELKIEDSEKFREKLLIELPIRAQKMSLTDDPNLIILYSYNNAFIYNINEGKTYDLNHNSSKKTIKTKGNLVLTQRGRGVFISKDYKAKDSTMLFFDTDNYYYSKKTNQVYGIQGLDTNNPTITTISFD